MAYNANEAFNQALEIFSSLYQDMAPSDVPAGLSPDCQDVAFLPGGVFTRPALNRLFTGPESSANIVSVDEFPTPDGDYATVWLSSLGNLWARPLETGVNEVIASVIPGIQFKSAKGFNKQWFGFYSATLAAQFSDSPFVGIDVPRYYDGQNVWRVTQDAPGANPTFANIPSASVLLAQSAPLGTATVTGAQSSGLQVIVTPPQNGPPNKPTIQIIYTTITYTCSAPVPVDWVGLQVTVAGLTGPNSDFVNITAIISAVSGDTFTIGVGTGSTDVILAGQSGTATLAGNYLARIANIVTAYLSEAIPNLVAGLYVSITGGSGTPYNGPNWTITSIGRDATGLVTVTVSTQLTNLPAGATLFINASDTTDFPPSYQTVFEVTSITSGATTFTISDPTWGNGAIASSSGGSVYQTWGGTFQVQSTGLDANNNIFFTYFQLGPDSAVAGGNPSAQIVSQIPPGPRNAVLMFKSVNGAITAPSVPIQISVVGGSNLLYAQNVLLGPPGTAQRVIAFTPAYGSSYYYITPSIIPSVAGLPPVLSIGTIINDNTSTNAIIDFSDQQLTAATQIDVPGNDLFNQVVLAPCLGCIQYEGRMLWWGEINNIKNLINPGFDGGNTLQSAAGVATNGTNEGIFGVPWNNPSNITSDSAYADVTVSFDHSSDSLITGAYGFNVSAPAGASIYQIVVNVQGYVVGSAGPSSSGVLSAYLLRAGAIVGTPQQITIIPGASALAPIQFQFTFSGASFAVSDLNNIFTGVAFVVSSNATASGPTLDVFLRSAQMSVVVVNNFPAGWSALGSTGGSTTLVPVSAPLTPGFVVQMAGASGLMDCLISQPFYQDYYGAAIGAPNTTYYWRLLVSVGVNNGGNLVCVIYSPSQGVLATASIALTGLTSTWSWQVAAFNLTLPATIPPDAQVQVYLQNSASIVFIKELEYIDQEYPVNFQQLRASYYNNPFGFDEETGVMQIAGSWKIVSAFTQRGYFYALTDGPMFQGINNGQTEPNDWSFLQFADECDCFGPAAVASTEDLAWWAGPISGVRVFNGSKPSKINQEIQPTWDGINDAYPLAVWVANDPNERQLYIGVPNGSSPIPNLVIPMSYRDVGDVANDPAPLRQSLSGKMIPLELCRKWNRWNMPMLCGSFVTEPSSQGNKREIVFGGRLYGNLYSLNPAKYTDDDYGVIRSYYTTCFFFNHETEQAAPGLGLHRKLFTFLSLFVSGIGNIQITPLIDSLTNPLTITPTVWNGLLQQWSAGGPGTFYGTCNTSGENLTVTSSQSLPPVVTQVIIDGVYYGILSQTPTSIVLDAPAPTFTGVQFIALYDPPSVPVLPLYALSQSPTHDLEWALNVRAERMALKIAVFPLAGQTDAAFNLQHLVVAGKQDRTFPVRGALLP